MKYQGKLNALKHFQDGHYAVAELDFQVEGEVLLVPSLPFVMMRLDQPHGRFDKEGWRFEVKGDRYMVPAEELARIIRPHTTEENNKKFERFYDVWQIKKD